MHIFSSSIAQLVLAALFHYRYVFLFPLLFLEATLIMMACGFMISVGLMTPWIALPILIAGDIASDYMYYLFGKYGTRLRLVRYIIRVSRFESWKGYIEQKFHHHSGKILVIGKLTHAFAMPVLIGSGYFNMNLKKFFGYNLIGAIIKCSVLMYLGYLVGAAYLRYARHLEYRLFILSVVPILLLVLAPFIASRFVKPVQDNETIATL